MENKNSRLGAYMFLIYTLIYTGFILTNILANKLMQTKLGSFNLAIVYGFGLIILAVLLASFYNHICSNSEKLTEEK